MSSFGIELSSPSWTACDKSLLELHASAGEVVDVLQPLAELLADPGSVNARGGLRLRSERTIDQVLP